MRLLRILAAATVLPGILVPLAPGAAAQQPGAPATAAPLDALAEALLRVEYALRDRPAAAADRAALNRAFDQATLAFFAGQVEPVVAAMDALVARIEPEETVREAHAAAAAATVSSLADRGREITGSPPLAYRLVIPPGAPAEPEGFPVVVALHGAGGNEHMFVEAYGAGRLADLAVQDGFVLLSPSTIHFAQRPGALEALLEAVEDQVPVDRSRVFLVGHSMGAGAAWATTLRDPGAVRGVVCIAGPCGAGAPPREPDRGEGTAATRPPLLVVAGALDPLSPPARLEAAAAQARDAGWEVKLRTRENEGHTLIVGEVIDDVVAWLLALKPRD